MVGLLWEWRSRIIRDAAALAARTLYQGGLARTGLAFVLIGRLPSEKFAVRYTLTHHA